MYSCQYHGLFCPMSPSGFPPHGVDRCGRVADARPRTPKPGQVWAYRPLLLDVDPRAGINVVVGTIKGFTSHELRIEECRWVYNETLAYRKCAKDKKSARRTGTKPNASLFISIIVSKVGCPLGHAGRRVIQVNARTTSKMCSRCGELVAKLLSARMHSCPHCGLVGEPSHIERVLHAGV